MYRCSAVQPAARTRSCSLAPWVHSRVSGHLPPPGCSSTPKVDSGPGRASGERLSHFSVTGLTPLNSRLLDQPLPNPNNTLRLTPPPSPRDDGPRPIYVETAP